MSEKPTDTSGGSVLDVLPREKLTTTPAAGAIDSSLIEVGQRVRLTYPREGAAYPLSWEGEVIRYEPDSGDITLKWEQGIQNLNIYDFAPVTILRNRKV